MRKPPSGVRRQERFYVKPDLHDDFYINIPPEQPLCDVRSHAGEIRRIANLVEGTWGVGMSL